MKKYKTMRRILATVLLCFLCFAPISARAMELEDARDSVFRVAVKDENGTLVVFGSSFAVGESEKIEYLVTNYHVISGRESGVFIWRDKDVELKCTVALSLPDKDLAILKLDQPIAGKPLPLGSSDTVKVGDDVYILGYPTNDISNSITSYPSDVSISKGVISKKTNWQGVAYYQIDAAMNSGNSGGPLWHKDGYVVGVATMKMQQSEGINGASMIEEAITALNTLGVAFATAPLSPDPSPSISISPSITPDVTPTLPPVTPAPHNSLAWLWLTLFLIAAVLFVIVIGYILLKRKGARMSFKDILPRIKKGRGYVVGRAGPYAGAVIALEGETVFFGRDPERCQIVFGQENRMISRVHCSLRYDDAQQVFVLENYSQNGTYLADGREVGDGESAYLYSGNGFYLVDEGCAFVVRENAKDPEDTTL